MFECSLSPLQPTPPAVKVQASLGFSSLQLLLEVSWNIFQQQLPSLTKEPFCFFTVCLNPWPQQWPIWQHKCKLLES